MDTAYDTVGKGGPSSEESKTRPVGAVACKMRSIFLPLALLAASAIFFAGSAIERLRMRDIGAVTARVSERVGQALRELETRGQENGPVADLPRDMSLYRYENDSLVYWRNPLPVINDNIAPSPDLRALSEATLSPRHYGRLPISGLTEEFRFTTLGSKWYLARMVTTRKGNITLEALYICEGRGEMGDRHVARRLGLPANCFISDLPQEIGYPVLYDGRALFFIGSRTLAQPSDSAGRWLGLAFLALFFVSLLRRRPGLRMYLLTASGLTACYFVARFWGDGMVDGNSLFSAQLYADGPIWSSYGNLMLQNIYYVLLAVSVYQVRRPLTAWTLADGSRRRMLVTGTFLALCLTGLTVHGVASGISFLQNSSIPVYFTHSSAGMGLRAVTFLVYTLLLAGMLLFLLMLRDLLEHLPGIRLPRLDITSSLLIAFILSAGISATIAVIGMDKEQKRTQMWAERLSMERDMMLEMHLRAIEGQIAADPYLNTLSSVEGGESLIRSHMNDNYLAGIPRTYRTSVSLFDREEKSFVAKARQILGSEAIAPGSLFHWECDENGILRYFALLRHQSGKLLTIEIESVSGREIRSYRSLVSPMEASAVYTPEIYSYAKYLDGHLVFFKGTFPYATRMEEQYLDFGNDGKKILRQDGWVHFFNTTGPGETVVISRKQIDFLSLSSSILLRMMAILITLLVPVRANARKWRKTNSLTRRIGRTVLLGIAASLACIVFISLRFVIDSARRDREKNYSDRISTVQAMLEKECAGVSTVNELRTGLFKDVLSETADMNKSDLSLFTPHGTLFMTTIPNLYDEMRIGSRMDDEAYYDLCYRHRRFCRLEKRFEGTTYTVLSAPVFNRYGEMVCLVSLPLPYTRDFISEAVPHAVLLIVVSLLLLIICQGLIYKFTDKVFGPIKQISDKMETADLTGLEHIEYEADDEIASLIKAYNRMVDVIESSARMMAGKERDKAWSEMARQVAHEIKNPLTPIKLDLQRLIRLKESGKSEWEDKFDNLSRVILENIDVLTETANDFSSFAKLYTQEPVEFDLDRTLSDQISLFDNKDHIEISYVGLKDTVIHGPKPQLIRVIVNLVTNSVQSIENAGMERGRILVCLRKAAQEGMLDITVEDNGPGVAEENIGKLFTPNFTTKTGGAGIGLAMCRNIVQMCDGSISYSRSFTLGGACFTVTLPER